MKLPRFFEHDNEEGPPRDPDTPAEHQVVELDPDQLRTLSNVFSAPKWLRDAGLASWLLAGVAILLVGVVWLLALTETIVGPVTVGLIVAVVASPAVAWLQSHHVGRVAGAGIVVLVILALAVGVLLLVVGGITSQGDAVRSQANHAAPGGSAPGAARSVDVAYSDVNISAANRQAQAQHSQPIALRGWREAINAPMVASRTTVST